MGLTPGTRLGAYEVLSALGAGGMGEVYRARDTKLGREVAIKVLPEAWAFDADRAARFEREAQVLASLNHPHIAALYGMEESGGRHFLVMELVEGETLAERLARGALPVNAALEIAHQIAEALEAAHEKGITHRDLKPANVKITPNEQAKVLDFGLAKVMDPVAPAVSPAPATNSPTLSMMATQAGVIFGTAAYMSPEQAQGLAADARSDVFSFGSVLYEMLTGRQPFQGDTVAALLASVLVREPDLAALPPHLNPRLPELLKRCLEKNPKRRWQAVGDLRAEIEAIAAAPLAVPALTQQATTPRPPWRRAMPVAGTALLVAALTSAAWWGFRPPLPPPTVTRFSFTLPQGQEFGAATQRQVVVAMSPDGMQVVYVAGQRLYLRSIGNLEPRAISAADSRQDLRNPVFSPDGQSIVFWSGADNTLKRISARGGAAVTICPADPPFGMSWGIDGIVFGQGSKGVMRVSPNGGQPERLVSVKEGEEAHGPQVLPGGQAVLFTLATGTGADRWDRAQVVVQSLRSGERRNLVNGGSDARYLPTGHIVYALGGILFALPFDVKRLEVTAGPVPMVEGVQRTLCCPNSGSAQFSFSDTGSLIYLPGSVGVPSNGRTLGLADRKGDLEILKLPRGSYEHPRISPDGRRVAFGTDDGKEAVVWIYELAGKTSMRRLTFGGRNRFPIWSADGQHVALQSNREGDMGIFWQRADGTGAAERLTKPDQGTSHVPESWSRDGTRFLFEVTKGSNVSLWTFSFEDKKATPFGGVRSATPITAAFSPDGRWVVYHSDETGRDAIYVQPFPATGAKYQIPKNDPSQNDHHPVWSSDGKELFYIPAVGALAAVSVTTRPSVAFGNAVPVPRKFTGGNNNSSQNSEREYDVTPDGKIVGPTQVSEQGQTGIYQAEEIRVVLNWMEELKARVPTK